MAATTTAAKVAELEKRLETFQAEVQLKLSIMERILGTRNGV
jgi:hypothetical protein